MRLEVNGDIISVFDDHDKKVGAVVLSRHPRHRSKPYSDGKTWYASRDEALLALLKRKRVNIKL